jgi:hypothetical protein
MVTFVHFPKKDAIPRLEKMKEEADRLAEECGLNKERDCWWDCLGDDTIFFAFAKGEKGHDAAVRFAFNCKGIPSRMAGEPTPTDWSRWPDRLE